MLQNVASNQGLHLFPHFQPSFSYINQVQRTCSNFRASMVRRNGGQTHRVNIVSVIFHSKIMECGCYNPIPLQKHGICMLYSIAKSWNMVVIILFHCKNVKYAYYIPLQNHGICSLYSTAKAWNMHVIFHSTIK